MTPHIFHEREITQLLVAAHELMPRLRAATFETLFGLLACAGLRVSEALHLLDRDVDLKQGLLTIRQAKFAKSRIKRGKDAMKSVGKDAINVYLRNCGAGVGS